MATKKPTKKQIEKLIASADKFIQRRALSQEKIIAKVLRNLENKLVNLAGRLSVDKNGNVKGPTVTFKQLERLQQEVLQVMESEYNIAMRGVTLDLKVTNEFLNDYYKELGLRPLSTTFTKGDLALLNRLRKQTFDRYKALGIEAANKINEAIQNTVVAGDSFSLLVNRIKGSVRGAKDVRGVPMEVHAQTLAQDSLMRYYNTVHKIKAGKSNLRYFLYAGDIVNKSRDFCVQRAGGVFTAAEIDKWNTLEWSGKNGNVWTDRGGYNCRHHFIPVLKEWIDEGLLDAEIKEIEESKENVE